MTQAKRAALELDRSLAKIDRETKARQEVVRDITMDNIENLVQRAKSELESFDFAAVKRTLSDIQDQMYVVR